MHSARGIHPLLLPLYAGHSSMSIPGRVHPLLLPLYLGNGSTSITEAVHPLLQPLFSRKCPPSHRTRSKSIQKPLTQPEVPASCDPANSETQETPTTSTEPNVSTQGFSMDMANSSLWDDKPPWSSEKVELPLCDTDMKDPSCIWDLDLSHKLAAKLLIIDDQPSLLDQQMLGQNSFTYAQDTSMANTTARCVMTKENLMTSLPEEASVVDLPSPLSIPSKTTKDDLKVEIVGTFASPSLSMTISCPTKSHLPYSVPNTMLNLLTVTAVTDFSVKLVETLKPVNKVKLGEPPPWTLFGESCALHFYLIT